MAPALDLQLLAAFNDCGGPLVDAFFVTVTRPGFGATVGLLLAMALLRVHGRVGWAWIAAAVLAVIITDGVGANVLKPLIGRVRPNYALPLESVHVLSPAANVGSMPSLHAANAFALALVVAFAHRKLASVVYPVATVVALSRVYVGVHWPSDILVGALYGSAMAVPVAWVVKRWARPPTKLAVPQDEATNAPPPSIPA